MRLSESWMSGVTAGSGNDMMLCSSRTERIKVYVSERILQATTRVTGVS